MTINQDTIDPNAPAGGCGPGFSRQTGSVCVTNKTLLQKIHENKRWASLNQSWIETMVSGINKPSWNVYDDLIIKETQFYNDKFSKSTGFQNIDWKIFKAVLWVESGGPQNHAWNKRAMQIGNSGDPGFNVLKNKLEGSDLIFSDALYIELCKNIDTPQVNIRAGISYILTRLMKSETASIVSTTDLEEHQYTIKAGDTFFGIARKLGTTQNELETMNPEKKILHLGDKIKYKSAKMQRVIIGWMPFTTQNIADRYNVGDFNYATKLDFVLYLFNQA